MTRTLFHLTLAVSLLLLASAAPTEDLVDLSSVPGLDKFTNYTAKVYSGYLYVNENKSHHYLFVESQSAPATDPLILWLNGGPGCSSILGFLYEHGPFIYPDGSTELEFNQYAWNAQANVLYMESPACVGLSYCNDPNMPFDDNSTASDNLVALLAWFGKFPEYTNNSFFVAGESYAGVYVPYLSYWIDQHNSNVTEDDLKINLVGYAVGNPVTHTFYDQYSDLSFWATHAGISPAQIAEINTQCSPTNFDTNTCNDLMNTISQDLQDINIYDFFRYCFQNSTSTGSAYFENFKHLYNKHYGFFQGYEPDVNRPPCVDDVGAYLFLNNQTVRKGLHIWDNASVYDNHTWYMCANINYTPNPNASYWIYPHMIQKGYRILVYSGDSDGSVPTIGTIRWIEQLQADLGLKTLVSHRTWSTPGDAQDTSEVAGYFRKYDGFRFATVMGVGHMAPQWKRPASFKMFSYFLNDTDLT